MLKEILERIDSRLKAVDISESRAAKEAGLSDSTIRDIRRAVNKGDKKRGVSSNTLHALAPVLQTTPAWLLDECGPEFVPAEAARIQRLLIRAAKLQPNERDRLVELIEWELDRYDRSPKTAT